MKRSRLKNIITKSKEISNKLEVGDPFGQFKKSLPIEVDDNYRLEAAWKAYGSPKDYKAAIWEGLIQPIDENTYKLPSIGYNTETDEYEYLNKGEDNEIVAKDIRVWDNDVIPLVKELKLGGYVRTFNEEKNCWTYSKNSQKREESTLTNELQVINSFLKGGKPKKEKTKEDYYSFLKTLPFNLLKGNLDDGDGIINDGGYRMELLFQNSPDVWTFEDAVNKGYFKLNAEDGLYHSGSIIQMPDGNYEFLKSSNHPTLHMETDWYKYHPSANKFRLEYNLVTTDDNGNPLKYYKYVKKSPQSFKQGGQMSVIPEGALHARKNNMELAEKGEVTHKGIPVVDNDNQLLAEIEVNELILSKSATDKVEELYKKYNEEESSSKKDEIAIEMGKIITCEITKNTEDKTGLIEQISNTLNNQTI